MKPNKEHLSIREIQAPNSQFVFKLKREKIEGENINTENRQESTMQQQYKERSSPSDSQEQLDSKEEYSITSQKTWKNENTDQKIETMINNNEQVNQFPSWVSPMGSRE